MNPLSRRTVLTGLTLSLAGCVGCEETTTWDTKDIYSETEVWGPGKDETWSWPLEPGETIYAKVITINRDEDTQKASLYILNPDGEHVRAIEKKYAIETSYTAKQEGVFHIRLKRGIPGSTCCNGELSIRIQAEEREQNTNCNLKF